MAAIERNSLHIQTVRARGERPCGRGASRTGEARRGHRGRGRAACVCPRLRPPESGARLPSLSRSRREAGAVYGAPARSCACSARWRSTSSSTTTTSARPSTRASPSASSKRRRGAGAPTTSRLGRATSCCAARSTKSFGSSGYFVYRGAEGSDSKERQLERQGVWLKENLIGLGPTFIKIGQALGTRADLLPLAYIKELALAPGSGARLPERRSLRAHRVGAGPHADGSLRRDRRGAGRRRPRSGRSTARVCTRARRSPSKSSAPTCARRSASTSPCSRRITRWIIALPVAYRERRLGGDAQRVPRDHRRGDGLRARGTQRRPLPRELPRVARGPRAAHPLDAHHRARHHDGVHPRHEGHGLRSG